MSKKIAVVNDLSGFGRCSLSAAIPVISALRVQACPLATAVLSNQTCYDSFFIKELTGEMINIIDKWYDMGFCFDGIYTGFLSCETQAGAVEKLVDKFKGENIVFVLDPVMGDGSITYSNYSSGLRDRLLALSYKADIVVPNVTELCLLCHKEPGSLSNPDKTDNISSIENAAIEFSGKVKAEIIVTGINVTEHGKNYIYNLIANNGTACYVKAERIFGGYSGTGDIMASIVSAMAVRGLSTTEAVKTASEFISSAIYSSTLENTDVNNGVNFEECLDILTRV